MSSRRGYSEKNQTTSGKKPPQRKSQNSKSQRQPLPQHRSSHQTQSSTLTCDPQMDYSHTDSYHSHQKLQQEQQVFRNAEASKQMVYKVYANVIGVLEEVESRELEVQKKSKLQRSSVHYADLSRRNNEDVRSQLDTQLILFQTQIKSCAPEIKSDVREVLEKQTLKWVSKRQENHLPKSYVDEYAFKLYQIVADGKTQHPEVFSQIPNISESELKQNFQQVMVGEHDRAKLDKEFRDNPDKEAEMEDIREGSVSIGAERMEEHFPETKERMEIHQGDSIR